MLKYGYLDAVQSVKYVNQGLIQLRVNVPIAKFTV